MASKIPAVRQLHDIVLVPRDVADEVDDLGMDGGFCVTPTIRFCPLNRPMKARVMVTSIAIALRAVRLQASAIRPLTAVGVIFWLQMGPSRTP